MDDSTKQSKPKLDQIKINNIILRETEGMNDLDQLTINVYGDSSIESAAKEIYKEHLNSLLDLLHEIPVSGIPLFVYNKSIEIKKEFEKLHDEKQR